MLHSEVAGQLACNVGRGDGVFLHVLYSHIETGCDALEVGQWYLLCDGAVGLSSLGLFATAYLTVVRVVVDDDDATRE